MRTRHLSMLGVAAIVLGLAPLTGWAATILEDFESSSAASTTPPAGWSLVTVAGSPTYQTSAAGQGSNGTGGSAGLAGRVSSTAFSKDQLPGGYLVNSLNFDLGLPVSGSFDFQIASEDTYDDATFTIGAIADGITGTTVGELLSAKFYERTDGYGTCLANGNNTVINELHADAVQQDRWHKAAFTWTPTAGTTGNFSITITDLVDSSTVGTLQTTGFTFHSATAQVGFGSVNDTIRVDNVNIAETAAPLPTELRFKEGVVPMGGYLTDAVTVRGDGVATNQNSSSQIIVGRNNAFTGGPLRGLLEFDLTWIETRMGGNPFTIDDVSLVMTTAGTGGAGSSVDIRVLRLGEDFDETTATWNSLTPDGGDLTATELSALVFDPRVTGAVRTFLSTEEFKAAVMDALANDPGNVLRLLLYSPGDTETGQAFARFDAESVSTAGNRPELIVRFSFPEPAEVPEPATMALLSLAACGLGGYIRRRRPA